MKTVHFTLAAATAVMLLASCSATKKLNNRLQGSWNIDSYMEHHVGQEETAASNIGTVTFNDDDSGTKRISYRILQGQMSDNSRFMWSNTAKTVTVEGEHSLFAKTWIVIKNKKKMQEWRSTDGKGNVQAMILKK
jgi:hypothetical protein